MTPEQASQERIAFERVVLEFGCLDMCDDYTYGQAIRRIERLLQGLPVDPPVATTAKTES